MTDFVAILSRLTDWRNIVDLFLLMLIFYALLHLLRGTQAAQLVLGILIIGILVFVLVRTVELTAFSWLLRNSSLVVFVSIPVIFQPEIRRVLEQIGRRTPIFLRRTTGGTEPLINEIVRACEQLSARRHGTLLVLEGSGGLMEYIDRGVKIDGELTDELLLTIFFPGTALHDGAVIVQNDKVAAASCILPLTNRNIADHQLGTRHRAAIGITELTDAMSVVVSEETGAISIATGGRMARRLEANELRRRLTEFYDPRPLMGNAETGEFLAEDR